MTRLRIRTQLLIATWLIISGITTSLLIVIHHTIGVETQKQISEGTQRSVRAFESVQRQRELQLSRAAAMLANLPTLKALMTTGDSATIQDGSASYLKLAGSDLLALAKPDRHVVAMHLAKPNQSSGTMQRTMERSLNPSEDGSWWYDEGRLYWVFERPIIAGVGNTSQLLGILAVGYQVDSSLAEQLAVIAGNQIALETGNTVIASTLPAKDEAALQHKIRLGISSSSRLQMISLETDQYTFSSVLLRGAAPSPVRCYVLMPLGPVNNFLRRMNITIYLIGASAVILGALVFGFVARTITRPLDNLVAGVHALSTGNFTYSIIPSGSSEVTELTTAFAQMREQLRTLQHQHIETERIAALGRAASSISHDLRHYLATVVANAEFLYEADELKLKKGEIYEEIKTAVEQMTDLIDSLRELSSQRTTIFPEPGDMVQVIRHAIETIRSRPEYRAAQIDLVSRDQLQGVFDPKKLERAFFNLILNACEASDRIDSRVTMDARRTNEIFEVRVCDNGSGISSNIRDTLFDPFVSFGKPNGTGMGLAIVSKIVRDHGGSVSVESTSEAGTVMLVTLPCVSKSIFNNAKPALA